MDRKSLEDDLKKLVAILRAEGIVVDKLFLFGSHARGEAVRGSDIDLLLISRSFSRFSFWERAKTMGRIIRRHPRPYEILMMTDKEFRASRFASEIADEGLEIRVH
jgi:predicted nucleotidyltransferase